MAHIQGFLVITLLAWAAVSVSATTPELSTMTGETVNIPCLFENATIRNLFWYYNNGTERHNILSLAKGQLTLGAEYADRASLQDDNSTLILKDITVTDEGTYRCDVDRQGQTPVLNINTKLNVFSLRPDTLPVITPNCTGADESSPCSVLTNQSFILTCALPNVYPVEDTELIWYRDGERVSSTDDVTQNDDGTTDISRHIQVSETGNFTCNTTYLTANGRENTAVSVEVWIIPPEDVPNTSGKNLIIGLVIAGITIIVLLVIGIFLFICRQNSRENGDAPTSRNRNDDPQQQGQELLDRSPGISPNTQHGKII
ncbi:tyrosine-protein kinase-like otk [Strongylocentrotus purpuratus]|uniref:Ig-like domain-containing protein n=1 Tax=Strongylocentrotus purpuratus TaxID=7668 RepID=A0A7M7NCM5_STRPU|nr:tyrosine-protein kinase-like otk [Strongylocentrotus purpuratus]